MEIKVGAPPGGRVHWLSDYLCGEFGKVYKRSYNYKYHNYRFVRYRKRTMVDEFLIVRTSKKCYRVIYYNDDFKFFLYFSARNYKACADKMIATYNIFKKFKSPKNEKPKIRKIKWTFLD